MKKKYLVCCFSLDFDLPLLKHFIDHYIKLGIKPENFLFVLNVFEDMGNLDKGLKILSDYNIVPKDIWCYEYESQEKWQRVHMLLSKFVSQHDWIIHPDSDEFFEFPASLDNIINAMDAQGFNAAQGFLIDRLAKDGKIKDISSDVCLFEQFPARANLTNLIGLSGVKLMIYKGYLRANNGSGQIHQQCLSSVRYTHGSNISLHKTDLGIKINGSFDSNTLIPYEPEKFNDKIYKLIIEQHGFIVHHFKWHGSVLDKLKQRVITYKKLNRPQLVQSARLLKHYQDNQRFVF